jgi:hypothetical protein
MSISRQPTPASLDRNFALELVRATEAAAIAASRYLGRGDKDQVDQAAVDAMRPVLGSIAMRGTVVIGEGEKDEAPMLFNGEQLGDGTGRDHAHRQEPAQRARHRGHGRAQHHVRSRALCLHGQARRSRRSR